VNDTGAAEGTRGASPPFDARGATAVVTGAAGGIGIALVRELARRGAATVVAADLEESHTRAVAAAIDAEFGNCRILGVGLDVSDRRATRELVDSVGAEHGAIDLWCANAGIGTLEGIASDPATWQRVWEVNLMAHVHAATELVPRWIERGGGHLLVTASAAGLLTNLGDAPYSTTKHAAVAFAEWVAITHGEQGVGVTCLCPQGVRTPMVFGAEADEFASLRPGSGGAEDVHRDGAMAIEAVRSLDVLEPGEVATVSLDALEAGRFLALPHPEVAAYEQARAADHDRWIAGMRRLQRAVSGE
jgi:NAD(P)-dependent dehydrogenase (short-subunit alcohol dehydrogenase family)